MEYCCADRMSREEKRLGSSEDNVIILLSRVGRIKSIDLKRGGRGGCWMVVGRDFLNRIYSQGNICKLD